jgi:hypothetical protein
MDCEIRGGHGVLLENVGINYDYVSWQLTRGDVSLQKGILMGVREKRFGRAYTTVPPEMSSYVLNRQDLFSNPSSEALILTKG